MKQKFSFLKMSFYFKIQLAAAFSCHSSAFLFLRFAVESPYEIFEKLFLSFDKLNAN